MAKVLTRSESQYLREYNPYYDSRASFGREADTIILYVFKTPTGKWSHKLWQTLRFSSESPKTATQKMNLIEKHRKDIIEKNKADIKKGYKLDEIILYSGNIGSIEAFGKF